MDVQNRPLGPAVVPTEGGPAVRAAEFAPERPGWRQVDLTWVLTAGMALIAAVIVAPGWLARPAAAVPDIAWVLLLPMFALAEVVVIHLPTQRNAHGHTLREIPAVLGLTFLAPEQYVSAYVVGAALALVFAARMRGIKLAFNAAMFALEAAVGSLVYSLLLGADDPLSLQGWLAVLVAVLVTDLISAAAVTAAISLTEGVFDSGILREALRSGSVAAFINTCVALLVATLVVVRPSALPLLGVVVVLLVMGYRVYISLARSHAQTQLLYRLVEQTSSARSVMDVAQVVLREATQLMHADRAFLVEVLSATEVRYYTSRDDVVRTTTVDDGPTAWWWSALDGGIVHHESQHRGRRDSPATAGGAGFADARDGLAATLGGEGSTRSVLVVCDPAFESESFSDDDRQAFEALAAHTGVALDRARSVSDLQALAGELEVARDAALAASEAKSLFLANMSHEIRTPLTTVLATAELLEDTPLEPAQEGLLERMQRQGELLKALVENILDFSRIEAGQLSLASKAFDLHSLVADAAADYATRAPAGGPVFEWQLDPDVPSTVIGDPGRLFQLLTNLLDNAFKFTHVGRVRLEVRGATSAAGVPGVSFAVHDTGIGIAAEDQEGIFEVFNQVDGSATRRYEGTGLGLAICRQLTELMGGDVVVESELGAGSTFTTWLPVVGPGVSGPTTSVNSPGPAV